MKQLILIPFLLLSIVGYGQILMDPTASPTPTRINDAIADSYTASGTNTYIIGATGTFSYSFLSGKAVSITFINPNTTSATLNFDGLGARNIQKYSSGSLVDVNSGDLTGTIRMRYDGTVWITEGGSGSSGTSYTFDSPLSETGGTVSIQQGNGSQDGFISSTDWTTFNNKAPINSPTFTGTVSGITKSMVVLGNVDNTSDANKPVSTATQTALNLKEDILSFTSPLQKSGTTITLNNILPTKITVAGQTLLGNSTSTVGTADQLSLGSGLGFSGNQLVTTGAPPTGSAGGDLTGTYPNPTINNLAVTNAKINDVAVTKVTGTGTGVNSALANNIGSAGAPILFNGAGGTPSSMTGTNITGIPNAGLNNSSLTVNGNSVSLGGSTTVTAVPSGSAGGDLTGTYPNPTLVTTAVTPGSYTSANLTVDSKGRITAASNGGGGGGTVTSVGVTSANGISATPTPITTSGNFTFSLGAITPTSVNGTNATEIGYVSGVTSALQTQLNSKTPSSRLINTTAPLTGGGDLSADRTLAISDAEADGSTKGASTYAAADFNSSSGVIALDYANSNIANKFLAINTQTSNYTAVLTDKDTKLVVMNSAIATNFTVPPNGTVAFPVGTILSVMPIGGGSVTIVPGGGVTVNPPVGGSLINTQQGSPFYIWQSATNIWYAWNGTPIIGSGLSVFGVTGSSSTSYASIVGGADQVLRVNSAASALAFGSLDLSKSGTVGSSQLPIANGGTGGTVGSWLISGTTTPTGNMTIARGANTLTFTGSYSGTTPGLTETISEVATANAQQVIGRDYNDSYSNGGFTTTTYVGARWRAGRYGFNTGTSTVEGTLHAKGETAAGTEYMFVGQNSSSQYAIRIGNDLIWRGGNNGTPWTFSSGDYSTGANNIAGSALRMTAIGGFALGIGTGTGNGVKLFGTTGNITGPVTNPSFESSVAYVVTSGTGTFPFIYDTRTFSGAGTSLPYFMVEPTAGRFSGLGLTAPTAMLEISAGTTTYAPLKLTSGTNKTTPAAGEFEYDGTNLFFTPSATRLTNYMGISGSASLDFASTGAQAASALTITVTGAADGDEVILGVPNASFTAGLVFTARVSATNTVSIQCYNGTIGAIDPASGTFKVSVIKR